jgi:hypothetical protein
MVSSRHRYRSAAFTEVITCKALVYSNSRLQILSDGFWAISKSQVMVPLDIELLQ